MERLGITRERFLEKVEEIAATDIVYQEGKDGSNGACDCIGLIIRAIRQAGAAGRGYTEQLQCKVRDAGAAAGDGCRGS